MEVFEKIGLFNEKFGFAKRGTSHIQAEEVEFSLRMKNKLGEGVIYNPEAIVYHKISQSKVKVKMLLKRAFYQGYSKAIIGKNFPSLPESLTTEKSYLKRLFSKHIPQRIKNFFTGSNRIADIKQLSFLVTAIFTVGFGFMCGYMKKGQ
jgi:GT2 family glycosyltransferase